MNESYLLALIIAIIYIFLFLNKSDLAYIESKTGTKYLVQNDNNKVESANTMELLIGNMYKLRNHLEKNIYKYPDYQDYIEQLSQNFNESRTSIYENTKGSSYTSYSVNKGEEIVFCLKSKKNDEIHNINLLMYVAIHEMAHLGCPEIGHTPLFNKIFKFFLEEAIKLNLYIYDDYSLNPKEYCGMLLTSNII